MEDYKCRTVQVTPPGVGVEPMAMVFLLTGMYILIDVLMWLIEEVEHAGLEKT